MFEQFTDRARKVMALANQQAQRFSHEYIGAEHILLALVVEGAGVGACVLRNLNVDLDKVVAEVEKHLKRNPDPSRSGKLPQTPEAKKVVLYAIEEARSLGHSHVGTEHVLLGLLRDPETIATQILIQFGLELDRVRKEILTVLTKGDVRPSFLSPLFGYSAAAERVILNATFEAKACHAPAIGTGHILIGLLREKAGVAAQVLATLGLQVDTIEQEMRKTPEP